MLLLSLKIAFLGQELMAAEGHLFPHLLLQKVNLERYPQLKKMEYMGDYPGGVILEHRMMEGVRWVAWVGAVLAPIRWWQIRRRVLNPIKREAIVLRPLLEWGIAGTTALGMGGGALFALWEGSSKYPTEADVVQGAIALRQDKVADRWARTTARLSGMGVVTVIFWCNGNLAMRVLLGVGCGTTLAIPISWSKLDQAMSMMF